jgi:Uma2 family endonuclease
MAQWLRAIETVEAPMSLQPKPRLTPEDYLALERSADFKSEYFNGEIFAMTGASESHNTIVVNVSSEIRQQTRCSTFRREIGAIGQADAA